MKDLLKHKHYLLAFVIIAFVYSNLLVSPVNLGSDFNFVSYSHFATYAKQPYVWDSTLNNGFGGYILFTLLFQPFSHLSSAWLKLTSNTFLLHKLIFLWPVLLIGSFSTVYAAQRLLSDYKARICFIIFYLINPYILMLISGGQIGVALAYMFLPAFFALWYKLFRLIHQQQKRTFIRSCFTILTIPVMLMLDARILLLSLLLISAFPIYVLFTSSNRLKTLLKDFLPLVIGTLFTTFAFHAHWILPALAIEKVALPAGYQTTAAANFFSFTRFAHSLTLTHPNYPENIFGQIQEINAFALIIPLFAFIAIKKKPTKLVKDLSLLALIFAFLSKGANEPFGEIYLWLFQHIPGMSLFRDATKFYIPLAFCYAYLISITLQEISTLKLHIPQLKLQTNHKIKSMSHIFTIKKAKVWTTALLSVGIFVIWYPTFAHQLTGTLQYRTYPQSYQDLETFLKADTEFGRVLWVPSREMYGYSSLNHPAVSLDLLTRPPECLQSLCQTFPSYPSDYQFNRNDLSKEISIRMNLFTQDTSLPVLNNLAVKYVVLSPDIDHTLYTLDYKPDQTIYAEYKTYLDRSSYLYPVLNLNGLLVYKTTESNSLFTRLEAQTNLLYQKNNPTSYSVNWSGGEGTILMSQSYDQRWQLINEQHQQISSSQKSTENLNQFQINAPAGTYHIHFNGQQYANLGWQISLIMQVIIIASLGKVVYQTIMNRSKHR